jgi:hypothetical protein
MKDLESYIDEAIKNIRSDRAITTTLLMELMEYMKKDDERKEKVGNMLKHSKGQTSNSLKLVPFFRKKLKDKKV